MSTFLAELVGTMMLIVLGGGVVAGSLLKFSKGENGGWVVITIAWGLAVAMAAYAVGGISGAHLNPARDLGPRIAHLLLPIPGKRDPNWSYAWVPIVGPIIGGVFCALFYKQFFLQEPSIMFWIFAIIVFVILIGAQLTQPKVSEKGRA